MKKKTTASQDNLKGNISKSSLGILNTLKEDIMTSIMSEKDENDISVEEQKKKYLDEQKSNIVEDSNREKETSCKSVNIPINNTVKEYESKGVKEELGKKEKTSVEIQNKVGYEVEKKVNNLNLEEDNNNKLKMKNSKKRKRSKRSFMLDDTVIQRLNLLKLCMSNKDLSTIVEDSVNQYFDSNKESIDRIFDIYDKVK